MRSFKEYMAEEIHAPGTHVAFHGSEAKGMISGKVVRYEKGGPKLAPHYVISHGEAESAKVPPHKVEKYVGLDETVGSPWIKGIDALPSNDKFQRATKTAVHYTGMINGKTYVVPHSFHGHHDVLHGTKTTEIRHAIVTSPHHIQHNNPDLSPEEVTCIHSHIKDIHGVQAASKYDSFGKLEEHLYLGFDHTGKQHEITAASTYDAHRQVLAKAKTPKSKIGRVHVHLHTFETPEGEKVLAKHNPNLDEGKRVPNPFKVGDKVKLHPEALKHHAQSVPAHAGYSHEGFQWREHLRKLEGRVGTVSRVFDSGHTNVDYDGGYGAIGIDHKSLVHHMTEDLKADWNRDFSPNRRSNIRRTLKQQISIQPVGKGTKAWRRADKEDRKPGTVSWPSMREEYEYPDPGQHGANTTTQTDGSATRRELKAARPMRSGAAERFMRRYGKTQKEEHMFNEASPSKFFKHHDVARHHQTKIAKQTLRMPDAMVGVMGGGSKEDARAHLKRVGWTDKMIHHHEHGPGDSTMHHLDEASPKPEDQGKMLHCFTCGKMRIFKDDGKLKCPVCKTKKVIGERALTSAEDNKKEEIVMSMKKKLQGFKERYGEKAKSVMYATATKQAKRLAESEQLEELRKATLHSYIKKAADDIIPKGHEAKEFSRKSNVARTLLGVRTYDKASWRSYGKQHNRVSGIQRAADRLVFKESEQLDEGPLNFMATYNHNESANRHTANIVHLAKHFGDEGDKAQAKFYADELKKHGHNKHHEAQYEIHKKLWPKAAKAHNLSEEVHAYDVHHKGKHIDTIFYGHNEPVEEVKKSLINHDGYHPNITVRKQPRKLKESEQLTELSKGTLKNYIKKSAQSLGVHSYISGSNARRGETAKKEVRGFFTKSAAESDAISKKREAGIQRAAGKLEEAAGMSFADAIKVAKAAGHRIAYGTASTKWHTIDAKDRDYKTSFSLDPHVAERHGEAAARRVSVAPRHLEESSTFKTVKSIIAEAHTREHFRQVAEVIKRISDVKERQEIADHNAALFAKKNSRFDHAKFHAAAGTVHKKD